MDWLRAGSILALLVVATVAGGMAVRLTVAAGDRRAAVTIGLVILLLGIAIASGARNRRWRQNPYW